MVSCISLPVGEEKYTDSVLGRAAVEKRTERWYDEKMHKHRKEIAYDGCCLRG